jgi:hypothetical protein
VAWTAGRFYSEAGGSPSYPLPHIQLAAFDTTDILHALVTGQLRKIRDQYIWNSTTAYADPILATNSDDDVGITFAFATGNSQPAPAVGILTNSGFTQRAALSEAPAVAVQGDYAGLQPDFPDATRFVAANTFNPRANNEDWLFTRFGRAPRTSPPAGRTPTGIRITRATGTQFDCCFTGDTVQVTGLLEGAPAGSAVRLEYTAPTGSSVPTVQNVTADEAGNFHGSFAASQNGTWRVVAVYAGDSQHDPSTSDPFFVSVQNPPG